MTSTCAQAAQGCRSTEFAMALAGGYVSVGFTEFMPINAMRFPSIMGGYAIATKIVLARSHNFHVISIHAKPRATEMVDLHVFWNLSKSLFVGEAVSDGGSGHPLHCMAEGTIARVHASPCPEPASCCLSDVLPESLGWRIIAHALATAATLLARLQRTTADLSLFSTITGATPVDKAFPSLSDFAKNSESSEFEASKGNLGGHRECTPSGVWPRTVDAVPRLFLFSILPLLAADFGRSADALELVAAMNRRLGVKQ